MQRFTLVSLSEGVFGSELGPELQTGNEITMQLRNGRGSALIWRNLLRGESVLYIQLYLKYVNYATNAVYIKYVQEPTLVTADSSWAASSIDVVLLLQNANNSPVEHEIWAAFRLRVSRLLSPVHRSLGMLMGPNMTLCQMCNICKKEKNMQNCKMSMVKPRDPIPSNAFLVFFVFSAFLRPWPVEA